MPYNLRRWFVVACMRTPACFLIAFLIESKHMTPFDRHDESQSLVTVDKQYLVDCGIDAKHVKQIKEQFLQILESETEGELNAKLNQSTEVNVTCYARSALIFFCRFFKLSKTTPEWA